MLQPLGEEKNFYPYNEGRLPYLRADLAQKTSVGHVKDKIPSHCIYRIRLAAIFVLIL
jgi:hypothetical protein